MLKDFLNVDFALISNSFWSCCFIVFVIRLCAGAVPRLRLIGSLNAGLNFLWELVANSISGNSCLASRVSNKGWIQ